MKSECLNLTRTTGSRRLIGASVIHASFLSLVSSLLLSFAGTAAASELHWRNGEMIGGDFVGMEKDHVIWRTPMFGELLKIRLDVLKRVNRFKLDEKTEEPFSIRLADGSRLYGTITGMSEEALEVRSPRFDTLKIRRDAVVSVQRLKAEGMLFAQPTSTSGWVEGRTAGGGNNNKISSTGGKGGSWRVVPGAALQQAGWNRTVSLPVEAPELVEMQFTLSSTVRPEFKLELKAADKERVSVETWVDDLVLQGVMQGRLFQNLQRLTDDDRRISLRLYWNRKTGLCAIYSADGKKIAESRRTAMEPPAGKKPKPAQQGGAKAKAGGNAAGVFGVLLGMVEGIADKRAQEAAERQRAAAAGAPEAPVGLTLLNKGPDITLEALRIRAWDGALPTDLTEVRPRVELMDGRHVKGAPVRATATEITVRETGGRDVMVPWKEVMAVEMGPAGSPFFQIAAPSVELWFTDGEWIQGTLQEVRNDAATLKTTFSDAPVRFKITRMHHLQIKQIPEAEAAPEADLAQLDSLTLDNKVLHGTLDAGGGEQPRWRLLGALEPATLAGKGPAEITRAASSAVADPSAETLFYLGNGDVLPGRLRAIDATRVDLESPLATVRHLPAARVQAIQFGGRPLNLNGFEDEGWRIVRGSEAAVSRNGKAGLDFEAGGSWGHPSFMQVNELNFVLLGNGFNALRVRLFADCGSLSAPSTNLLFGHMGSEVCFGLETSGEQMDRQFRVRSTGAMPVRIELTDTTVEVFLNGVSVRKFVIVPKMRSGSGIVFEPFSLWGNGEREVKISSFSARVAPGRIAAPPVEQRAKEHALTVPRFRKDDPPRHALIAANGDLLRGVIEAATAEHFAVRSGLETVKVPRDRVKAAVWLIKPVDDVNAAFEERARAESPSRVTHWLVLNSGGRLGLQVERFAEDAVIGKSELLGDCRVPLGQIHAIRSAPPPDSPAMLALQGWKLKFAPEPVLPETGGESSPLLNQDAKTFKLPLLAGGDFDLAKEKGKVIVLDFWATWCGPCIKSLPGMIDEMAAFDAGKVRFIGVNQAEPKDQVKSFLETRGWKLEVAFDASQRVGQSFGVEGIPHTVIIGQDGKVAYVKTGYEPDGAKKIAETVRKLLGEKEEEPAKK